MVLKHKTQLTFLKLIAFVLSCGGPSAKIAYFPRTAKQIADYFRENANVTVSLPVERLVSFVLQRWQAVIGPVQGYSLFDFLRRCPPV